MANIAASTNKAEESNKRTATSEDLKRLVRYYEWKADFMKGMGGMGAIRKQYLDRSARAKQVLSLRETDVAMASTVEEGLFTTETGELRDDMGRWFTLR